MDKRYQVFISSTYEDLQEERRKVIESLLMLDCIPTGMELFPASDDDSGQLIREFIKQCDYYIVIVGGRYGSTAADGRSYTEMEYDFATSAGIPTLAFLHKDPGTIAAGKSENSEAGRKALEAFRKRIENARHAKYWTDASELGLNVTQGMVSLTKMKPRIGWVRADQIADESASQEMLRLHRRIEELELRVAENDSYPPEGTEGLAQGSEPYHVHCICVNEGHTYHANFRFTWNQLLIAIGPALIDGAPEGSLKWRLGTVLTGRINDELSKAVERCEIREDDFQRIKLQFRALGAIKPGTPVGEQPTWVLTPYGDRLLTQALALHSELDFSPE